MNISCVICSEFFNPADDIFSTSCGHMFHNECLTQWVQKSKTCPQCRHKETMTTIHKIFLNFVSSEGIIDDIVTLQSKLDTVNFEASLIDKKLAEEKRKYDHCHAECTDLRTAIVNMEQKHRDHKQSLLLLKGDIKQQKEKLNEEPEHLTAKRNRLKTELENMGPIKEIISNAQEQVDEMYMHHKDAESLGILLGVAKSELTHVEKTINGYVKQTMEIGNQMIRLRKKCDDCERDKKLLDGPYNNYNAALKNYRQLQAQAQKHGLLTSVNEATFEGISQQKKHTSPKYKIPRNVQASPETADLSNSIINKRKRASPLSSAKRLAKLRKLSSHQTKLN